MPRRPHLVHGLPCEFRDLPYNERETVAVSFSEERHGCALTAYYLAFALISVSII